MKNLFLACVCFSVACGNLPFLSGQEPVDSFLLSDDLFYLVQLSSLKEEQSQEYLARHFRLDTPVFVEYREGYYRYYTGPFREMEEAVRFRDSTGIEDAFVLAFRNGRQVTNSGRTLPGVSMGRWIHPSFPVPVKADTPEPEPVLPDTLPDTLSSSGTEKHSRGVPAFIRKREYGRSTLFVLILYGVILYSITTMMVLLLIILINRNRKEREGRLKESLKEKYQSVLMNYLFDPELPEAVPGRLRKIASSPFKRRILIDQMIDLSINLRGQAAQKLRDLYIRSGLSEESVRKAGSRRWHIRVKGFRELAFMDIRDANKEIIRSLHSRNEILRMEAQLALVKLGEDNPYRFLDYLEMPFSIWEQMTVHEMLIHHELNPPDFSRWIHSKNRTVVIFSVKMIGIFKQATAYPLIVELLDHPDPEVRKATIRVLGEVKYGESILPLKRMYRNEPYENCLEIVRAMAKMPDQMVLKFLQLVIDREDDVQLQIEAVKAIHNMGPVGENTLKKMLDSDYKNYQIIIKHVLDKRIV